MRCLPFAIALLALPAHAATVLEPNDVQIVAFASDAPDAFVSKKLIERNAYACANLFLAYA